MEERRERERYQGDDLEESLLPSDVLQSYVCKQKMNIIIVIMITVMDNFCIALFFIRNELTALHIYSHSI